MKKYLSCTYSNQEKEKKHFLRYVISLLLISLMVAGCEMDMDFGDGILGGGGGYGGGGGRAEVTLISAA